MKKSFNFIAFILFLVLLSTSSCKKVKGLSNGNLSFSADTVVFDTVFTTIGTTTKQFKIYNNSSKSIRIDEIELMGGASSPFKINIDGYAGNAISDITLEPHDSLFGFVTVKLKVNNQTNPMVIEDSIRFKTNGLNQYVQLAVWGQDIYYHYTDFDKKVYDLNNDVVWPNDKPHLIYGAAIVDSARFLVIQKDTKIYLHKKAYLFVYKGRLDIQGTLGHEVTIEGDRLESAYNELPGQFYGVYFHQAQSSTINYTNIFNGTVGVHVYGNDNLNSDYTVKISNSKLFNNISYGLWIFSGAKVKAENCVIAKNGVYGVYVLGGGDFHLNNCTIVGYSAQTSPTPALAITNYYYDSKAQTTYLGYINEGYLRNCVIDGDNVNEIIIDTLNTKPVTSNLINLDIDYCSLKKKEIGNDSFYGTHMNWNKPSLFKNITKNDYHFNSGSILDNNGLSNSLLFDIEGKSRSFLTPDIGAYEN